MFVGGVEEILFLFMDPFLYASLLLTIAMGLGRVPLLREQLQEPRKEQKANHLGLLLVLVFRMKMMKRQIHTLSKQPHQRRKQGRDNNEEDDNNDN